MLSHLGSLFKVTSRSDRRSEIENPIESPGDTGTPSSHASGQSSARIQQHITYAQLGTNHHSQRKGKKRKVDKDGDEDEQKGDSLKPHKDIGAKKTRFRCPFHTQYTNMLDLRMREGDMIYRTCVTARFPDMAKVKYVLHQPLVDISLNKSGNISTGHTSSQYCVLNVIDLFLVQAWRFVATIRSSSVHDVSKR